MISTATVQHTEGTWLALKRAGYKPAEIARSMHVRPSTVYAGITAARQRESRNSSLVRVPRPPRLDLIFGASCKPLALLTCDDVHPHGPIPKGSICCCGTCHGTGIDGHPGLKRHPETDPKPEPKLARTKPRNPLTRKQRRKATV